MYILEFITIIAKHFIKVKLILGIISLYSNKHWEKHYLHGHNARSRP
jgi:hypothetical protein